MWNIIRHIAVVVTANTLYNVSVNRRCSASRSALRDFILLTSECGYTVVIQGRESLFCALINSAFMI